MQQLREIGEGIVANTALLGGMIAINYGGVMAAQYAQNLLPDPTLRASLLGGLMDMVKMISFSIYSVLPGSVGSLVRHTKG